MQNKKWIPGLIVILALIIGIVIMNADNLPFFRTRPDGGEDGKRLIGVFQVARHPVLDAMAQSFQGRVEAVSTVPVEFVTMVPEGDASKTEQMAQRYATGGFDLVYVIGTNLAQSLANKTSTIPIVLGAATDPESAGLVESWERPGNNVTGTSDLSPVESQLDRLAEILPDAKRIGIMYNPAEDNSGVVVRRFTRECEARGLTPVTATISGQNEIRQTLVSLAGRIDALYAPTDATLQSGFPVLINTANELKIPVFSCDEGTARKGAIFSVGFDYVDLGRISADMAIDILEAQANPAEMPVRLADHFELFYNQEQIQRLGLQLPASWADEGKAVSE